MEANRKLTVGFTALLIGLLLWIVIGLVFSISSWFEPAPPDSIKMDAYEEIAVTAGILNVALPIAILGAFAGFYLAKKRRIPITTPIVFSIVIVGLSVASICWWHHMDDAHGPNISLTRSHLWWGR